MTLWKKKLETILMNIYGNTEDSNQRLVKKTFMHKNLTDFDSIKGFLDHEEGILLYKMAKKYCIKTFAVEIGSYCGKSSCYIGMKSVTSTVKNSDTN